MLEKGGVLELDIYRSVHVMAFIIFICSSVNFRAIGLGSSEAVPCRALAHFSTQRHCRSRARGGGGGAMCMGSGHVSSRSKLKIDFISEQLVA